MDVATVFEGLATAVDRPVGVIILGGEERIPNSSGLIPLTNNSVGIVELSPKRKHYRAGEGEKKDKIESCIAFICKSEQHLHSRNFELASSRDALCCLN